MGWVLAAVLALIAFAAMVHLLGLPRHAREASAAALVLGLAGYALQGQPSLPGAPKAPEQKIVGPEAARAIEDRKAIGGKTSMADRFLTPADALARHGQYADAAELLHGAVAREPQNSEAWLAMANALVGHAEGSLSPAALLAFRRAEQAAPDHPGAPFFLGLALAQSGRMDDGRAIWADLLARTPADAPWRSELVARLADLDGIIAQQAAMQGK